MKRLVVGLVLLLVGCQDPVPPWVFESATVRCSPAGGLDAVVSFDRPSGEAYVRCSDRSKIRFYGPVKP